MFGYMIILFTVIPAIELVILIEVGTQIGAFNTLLLIVLTGIAGASLARYQGFITFAKIQESLNRGVMPNSELLDGLMILVGGIVLLTPGFITDAIGFLCLIPFTRSIFKALVAKRFEASMQQGQTTSYTTFQSRQDQSKKYDDIDI